MIRHIRAKSLALGMAALTICAAPVLARAQPYDQGGYATPGVGPGPGDYDQRRRDYDAQYGPGAYDRDSVDQERAREACRQQKQNNQVVGGVLGGIAGAVIGSNVARGGGREGGAHHRRRGGRRRRLADRQGPGPLRRGSRGLNRSAATETPPG